MFIRQNYRIYPTKSVASTLTKWLGQGRYIWNYMLNLNIEQYEKDNTFIFCYDMNNLLPALKQSPETEWLQEIPSQCLQQKCQDLSTALKQCGKKMGASQKGFAKFKSRKTDTSGIRFPKVKVVDDRLFLPKIKEGIKIRLHRPLMGIPGATTISRDAVGNWFMSIIIKIDPDTHFDKPVETINKMIGIDLGLKEFAIMSDGEIVHNPKFYKKAEAKLAYLQRTLSRKTTGSNSRNKARLKLAKHHKKIANQRKDFIHQTASTITKENDLICIESLNVKGMVKNRRLSKSISDVGWGMFISALKWQATKRGKHIVEVNRFYPSSKTCSNCGSIKTDLTLNDRTYSCTSCGFSLDRDLNAAINILNEGIRLHTAGTAEINACGDMHRCSDAAQEAISSLD